MAERRRGVMLGRGWRLQCPPDAWTRRILGGRPRAAIAGGRV